MNEDAPRALHVPPGWVEVSDYVPAHRIRIANDGRAAVADIERTYNDIVGENEWRPGHQLSPSPKGYWETDPVDGAATFVLMDGRHRFLAALAFGYRDILVRWNAPAEDRAEESTLRRRRPAPPTLAPSPGRRAPAETRDGRHVPSTDPLFPGVSLHFEASDFDALPFGWFAGEGTRPIGALVFGRGLDRLAVVLDRTATAGGLRLALLCALRRGGWARLIVGAYGQERGRAVLDEMIGRVVEAADPILARED